MYEQHTSNLEQFKQQLAGDNPDIKIPQSEQKIVQIMKNIIITIPAGYAGVGHIRTIFPSNYINAVYGKPDFKGRSIQTIVTPFFINQKDILMRTRAIWFQRLMDTKQIPIVEQYRNAKEKMRYKMVYDIDDFVWKGDREGEYIPDYNNGGDRITNDIRQASVEIMKMMDEITVSSQFLGDYIKDTLKVNVPIKLVENRVFKSFWGEQDRQPIQKRIEKPKFVWMASPTHWHEEKKLKGDIDNAWCDYIIKNVKDGNIEFYNMGCNQVPFYFKCLEGCKNYFIVPWTNSYLYHLPVKKIKADFSIGPLVPNYFNYSKSCIKMQESFAAGYAFIGSVFNNGQPSPYDKSFLKLNDNCSVEDIENLVNEYREPEKFNELIQMQYKAMNENSWYYESPKYLNELLNILKM
jgi:hypothetical protein